MASINWPLFFAANTYFWLMSSHHLRKEKNCLNCGHTVEERYCGNCGQENIEPRQTFVHLIAHFFEDLTHYEGKFWGTLRYLFFKPAYLTREFLAGKRSTYLPPVRLYIFASFIAFLLPAILPHAPVPEARNEYIASAEQHDSTYKTKRTDTIPGTGLKKADSLPEHSAESDKSKTFGFVSGRGWQVPGGFTRLSELDSAKKARSGTDDPMGIIEYALAKKTVLLSKYSSDIQFEMFTEALKHNFPKALFLYMPLFALVLRLFHRKKNWIYFDHGIFTLHYFSFLLLTFLLFSLVSDITDWVSYLLPSLSILSTLGGILIAAGFVWAPYYLFRAHHNMYGERRSVSALKSWGILLLNFVLFIAVLAALVLITILMLH